MSISRAWTVHEPTCQTRAVDILAGWILARERGCVVGLTRSGKSNLLGFVCRWSEVLRPYGPDTALKVALVQVDLNNLPGNDRAAFYRANLRVLYESRTNFAEFESSLAPTVETLYRNVEDKPDVFLSQSALREALFLFKAAASIWRSG